MFLYCLLVIQFVKIVLCDPPVCDMFLALSCVFIRNIVDDCVAWRKQMC